MVNVRLCLAEAFFHLHKTLDRLEIQQLHSKNTTQQLVMHQKTTLIQHYINHQFSVAIKNLKNDPSECVSELLVNYNVLTAEDADGLSNFEMPRHKAGGSDSEPQVEDFDISS